jgi:hypothetical protein
MPGLKIKNLNTPPLGQAVTAKPKAGNPLEVGQKQLLPNAAAKDIVSSNKLSLQNKKAEVNPSGKLGSKEFTAALKPQKPKTNPLNQLGQGAKPPALPLPVRVSPRPPENKTENKKPAINTQIARPAVNEFAGPGQITGFNRHAFEKLSVTA